MELTKVKTVRLARRLWNAMYISAGGLGLGCARVGRTNGGAVLALGLRNETLRQMASHLRTGHAVESTIFSHRRDVINIGFLWVLNLLECLLVLNFQ